MSLLSGIKFTPKVKKEKDARSTAPGSLLSGFKKPKTDTGKQNAAGAAEGGAAAGRMGWMDAPLNPALFASRAEGKERRRGEGGGTAAAAAAAAEGEGGAKEEDPQLAEERRIAAEIKAGKREPVTGMPYGLYDPKRAKRKAAGAPPPPEEEGRRGGAAGWRERMQGRKRSRAEGGGGGGGGAGEEAQWAALGLGGGGGGGGGRRGERVRVGRDARDSDVLAKFRRTMGAALDRSGLAGNRGGGRDRDRGGGNGGGSGGDGDGRNSRERERRRDQRDSSRDRHRDRKDHYERDRSKDRHGHRHISREDRSRYEHSKKHEPGPQRIGGADMKEKPSASPPLPRHGAGGGRDKAGAAGAREDGTRVERIAAAVERTTGKAAVCFTAAAPPPPEQSPPGPAGGGAPQRRPTAAELRAGGPAAAAAGGPPGDPNRLTSQALKAKLRGNLDEYERLMAAAAAAKAGGSGGGGGGGIDDGGERVVVLEEDPRARFGRLGAQRRRQQEGGDTLPGLAREDLRSGKGRGKLRRRSDWEDGLSVEDMLANERAGGRGGMDAHFARNIGRLGSRFRNAEALPGSRGGADEEEEIDTRLYEAAEDRMTDRKLAERQKALQIKQHEKMAQAMARCPLCMDAPAFARHRLLALGEHAALHLAPLGPRSLADGHCYLAPLRHVEASTACDEEVLRELEKFKVALRKMFASKRRGVIFLETSMQFHRRPHLCVEAVPVPWETGLDAALYFRQALQDAGDEWAVHRKLIPTKDKPVHRAVPKEFPYFHVEWEDGGYAHVIEAEDSFPRDFGTQVVCGMLGVDPPRFNRRGQTAVPVDREKEKVLGILEDWKDFDWTKELDGGEYMS